MPPAPVGPKSPLTSRSPRNPPLVPEPLRNILLDSPSSTLLALLVLVLAISLARVLLTDVWDNNSSARAPTSTMSSAAGLSDLLSPQGDELPHFVYTPASRDGKNPSAVVVFLHGAGGVKNADNVRGQSLTKMLLDKKFGPNFGYTVVIPVAKQRDWATQKLPLNNLLNRLIFEGNELGVDAGRAFLFGQSMGGNGVLELAMDSPGRWKAVVPVCG